MGTCCARADAFVDIASHISPPEICLEQTMGVLVARVINGVSVSQGYEFASKVVWEMVSLGGQKERTQCVELVVSLSNSQIMGWIKQERGIMDS